MTIEQLEKANALKKEIDELAQFKDEYLGVYHEKVCVLFRYPAGAGKVPMPIPQHIWEQLLAYHDAELTRKLNEFEQL